MISIKGMDKAEVLARLYNCAICQGMGFLHFDPKPMTKAAAQEIVAECEKNNSWYFDYLKGRVMKVDIGKDEFDERLYDRDNGFGAAEDALTRQMEL